MLNSISGAVGHHAQAAQQSATVEKSAKAELSATKKELETGEEKGAQEVGTIQKNGSSFDVTA